MNERRLAANRRNAKMSTGPKSRRGKQSSARNAFKHGLSIAAAPAADNVRALASLLSPTPCSYDLAALALEAACRIIDYDRVRDAHQHLYQSLRGLCGDAVDLVGLEKPSAELSGPATIPADSVNELSPVLLSDLAKQLDRLARYDRRTLSARDRALMELENAITYEGVEPR